MRYFGKDGAQCQLPSLDAPTGVGQCRKLGTAILHGRVPLSSVLLMGAGVAVIGLLLWVWSFVALQEGNHSPVRDHGAAVSIRR